MSLFTQNKSLRSKFCFPFKNDSVWVYCNDTRHIWIIIPLMQPIIREDRTNGSFSSVFWGLAAEMCYQK